VKRAVLAVAAALALAGCGASVGTPDLFLVTRTGAIPGARLTMLVNDGGYVTCDGRRHQLPSDRLLDARELLRQMKPYAKQHLTLPPGGQSILRYRIRTEFGTLAFSDDSRGVPSKLYQLPLFVRDVAQRVCGLAR
jgi:hypothetical protein